MNNSKIQNHKSKIANHKPGLAYWLTFTAIILVAFFFRFYRLADHPLGIFFDPAINALDAIRIMQRGGHVLFFPTNGGRESLFIYLLIPFIQIFGTIPFSIRALTATTSLLNVVFLFAFLYQIPSLYPLFSNPAPHTPHPKSQIPNPTSHIPHPTSHIPHPTSHTPHPTSQPKFWLATLATLALATSYWHIAISRLGQRPILVPMLAVLVFWFFLKGWSTGHKRWFVLSGLFMGLEGYTYSAARLLPVILVLAILPELFSPFRDKPPFVTPHSSLLTPHSSLRTRFTNLLIFGLTAALIYLPMAWYLLNHPAQFTGRAFSVMVWNFLDTPPEIAAEIGRNSARVAAFFCCGGSPNPLFGLPNYPGSHPVVLPFLLAGLIGALKNWRYFFDRLVALWWLIGLTPSIVAIEAPHPLRMIVAVVPTAILIGLGPLYLARWWGSKKSNVAVGRLLPVAALIILVPLLNNTPAYFHHWTQLQSTRGAYDYGAIAIRNTILEHAQANTPVYLPLARFNAPTLLYYLSDRFPRRASLSAPPVGTALVISPDKNAGDTTWVRLHNHSATVLPPLTAQGQQLVQTALAGSAATPIRTAGGEIIARLAPLSTDPVRFVETPRQQLDASFGPLRLAGATYSATINPPANLPVTLFWQAAAQTTNEYEVLVRLVDDSRRAWGNGDARPTGWVYPTSFWRPGIDKIAARHTVTLGPELPGPGRYWLAVSIFDPALGRRLPLTAGDSTSPDTFFVGPLKVPLPLPPEADQIPSIPPVAFGDVARLAGVSVSQTNVAPGQSIELKLLWRALSAPALDYTVFVHLLNANDKIVAGNDTQPVGGRYPTTIWTPGEQILDTHILAAPANLPPGQYRLAVGLYHQPTGERLPLGLPTGQTEPHGRLILPQEVVIKE